MRKFFISIFCVITFAFTTSTSVVAAELPTEEFEETEEIIAEEIPEDAEEEAENSEETETSETDFVEEEDETVEHEILDEFEEIIETNLESDSDDDLQDSSLVFNTLTDEATGISIEGMLPEEATISISDVEASETLAFDIDSWNMNMDYNLDSFDYMFIVNSYRINVFDQDDNLFIPETELLVRLPIDDESMELIGSNPFTLYENGEAISHSFDVDKKEITYLTNNLENDITVTSFETCYFYTVKFTILSSEDDSFVFSSEGRYKKGDDIILPDFYDSNYKSVETIDWSDVDSTVTHDAEYTKYIDKNVFEVSEGDEVPEEEAESYGEKLTAVDTTDDMEMEDAYEEEQEETIS